MINILTSFLVVAGFFFFFATAIGILRFPDFYSRMHAAGKGDAFASLLMLAGLALYNLNSFSVNEIFVSVKIILIAMFTILTSATATHAIVDAGFESGAKPWTKEKTDGEKQL